MTRQTNTSPIIYEIIAASIGQILALWWHGYSHMITCLWITAYIELSQIDGLVQDCSNSSVLAMEVLQSCTKPLRYQFIGWSQSKEDQAQALLPPILWSSWSAFKVGPESTEWRGRRVMVTERRSLKGTITAPMKGPWAWIGQYITRTSYYISEE